MSHAFDDHFESRVVLREPRSVMDPGTRRAQSESSCFFSALTIEVACSVPEKTRLDIARATQRPGDGTLTELDQSAAASTGLRLQ